MRDMICRMDIYEETLRHNPQFHMFMDKMHSDWRDWDYERQRRAAKSWFMGKTYGIPGEAVQPSIGE